MSTEVEKKIKKLDLSEHVEQHFEPSEKKIEEHQEKHQDSVIWKEYYDNYVNADNTNKCLKYSGKIIFYEDKI